MNMGIADDIGRYWAGAEVMYGIIIAMTFTSMLRNFPVIPAVIVERIILAALSCCIAWGIADGFFYLWERGYIMNRRNRIIDLSRSAEKNGPALSLVGEELDDTILRTIPPENRQLLYEKLVQFLSTTDKRENLSPREAATIILGTFLLSAGAGLVVVSPFFLISDLWQALALSNLLGVLLLFVVGYSRAPDRPFASRVIFGFGSSLVGIIIAGITVALGG